ncbi:MAG: NUDIX domain-containing protein [Clostridiaceae bacterium]
MKMLAVGILIQDEKALVVKRSALDCQEGLWGFPSVTVSSGVSEEAALIGEFKNQFGIEVKAEECFFKSDYQEKGEDVTLKVYLVSSEQGYVPSGSDPETRMVSKEELKFLNFKGEDIDIVNHLFGYF